jgi:lysyl-tRNA synthetase class 2
MSTEPLPDSRDAQNSSGGGDVVADRRAKLAKLRDEMKIDPFGRRVDGLISLADAAAKYDGGADEAHKANPADDRRPVVKVAGRIMLHRVMGNLIFMTLRDGSSDLQVAVSKKAVEAQAFALAKLVEQSDIVVARGPLAKTKTGEITVWAGGEGAFELATKSLAAPPGKWHGLQDAEQRYRQRYVDLWANPHVMKTMMQRTRIVEEIRQYLRNRGFIEVETPMMQTLAGGAAARPFTTHHNALDIDLFMRIAPELYLKRLLVGGFSKVFEINRNFRNEGISPRHNPEFTMLEAYEAFGSWETMADLVEEMICTVAEKVLGTLVIEHKNAEGAVTKTINLTRPWRRVSMSKLVEERTGWKFERETMAGDVMTRLIGMLAAKQVGVDPYGPVPAESQAKWQAVCEGLSAHVGKLTAAEQLQEVYEKLIEPTLIDPTFVTQVPSVIIPLARENQTDPFFADVYELAINGQEISPGYSELNDPDVQERHFRHQVGDKEEQQKVDEDFLNALRVGMPPAGGMGLGIDRLVMMLTGAESIRDVILFPLMRPQD